MNKNNLTVLLASLLLVSAAQAQTNCQATITGAEILCPNESGLLSAGSGFDTYQWYKKLSFSANPPELIPGATDSTLAVDYFNDAGFRFTVATSLGACVDTSAEVLVDGWAFLPITVGISGDVNIDPNSGALFFCPGDTIVLELFMPNDTNITWFKDGEPIAGENGMILHVTSIGEYTVWAAPGLCPDYLQALGLNVSVLPNPNPGECTTDVNDPVTGISELNVFPNPAVDAACFRITTPDAADWKVSLFSLDGRLIQRVETSVQQGGLLEGRLPLHDLPESVYVLRAENGNGAMLVQRVVKVEGAGK